MGEGGKGKRKGFKAFPLGTTDLSLLSPPNPSPFRFDRRHQHRPSTPHPPPLPPPPPAGGLLLFSHHRYRRKNIVLTDSPPNSHVPSRAKRATFHMSSTDQSTFCRKKRGVWPRGRSRQGGVGGRVLRGDLFFLLEIRDAPRQ